MTNLFKVFGDAFISEISADNYYMIGSGYSLWANSDTLVSNDESSSDSFHKTQSEILFGYKLSNTDVKYIFTKNMWLANTKYSAYESDTQSSDWIFTSQNAVYKCLDNANTVSTIEPTSKSSNPFITSDGYKWIYMFTVDDYSDAYYSNSTVAPIIFDSNIISTAVEGTIDSVDVLSSGNGYFSYTGNVISIVSNTLLSCALSDSGISNNSLLSYGLYVKSGAGTDNIFSILGNYSNSSGTYISGLSFSGMNATSTFVIAPVLTVSGDGINCKLQPVVNSISTGISKVYVIDRGSGYTSANVSISVSNTASFKTNISPPGGHQADPVTELQSNIMKIFKSFSPSDRDSNLSYRRIGLLKNPKSYGSSNLYSNAVFLAYGTASLSNTNGSFTFKDIITGSTSGANAEVIFANSSFIIYNYNSNTSFLANENIRTNSANSVISSINNPNITRNSGELIGFKNLDTIAYNTNTYSEDISLVIYKE